MDGCFTKMDSLPPKYIDGRSPHDERSLFPKGTDVLLKIDGRSIKIDERSTQYGRTFYHTIWMNGRFSMVGRFSLMD